MNQLREVRISEIDFAKVNWDLNSAVGWFQGADWDPPPRFPAKKSNHWCTNSQWLVDPPLAAAGLQSQIIIQPCVFCSHQATSSASNCARPKGIASTAETDEQTIHIVWLKSRSSHGALLTWCLYWLIITSAHYIPCYIFYVIYILKHIYINIYCIAIHNIKYIYIYTYLVT